MNKCFSPKKCGFLIELSALFVCLGGQAGNNTQDRHTNRALSSKRQPQYSAKKKITSPPNEWRNIPSEKLKRKEQSF